jgi:NADPH:quinone reductase-like Zn-dependent oxidoreductase
VSVPNNLSVVDAAAVPTSALTALQALRDIANVRPGQTVLVTGASGGVGSFAVQIAKAFGAEVTGVCSTRNVDLVRSLGADHVVDYTRTDFTRTEKRYDVILDNVEDQPLAAVRRALTPTGTLIPNSGRGGRWLGPLGRIVTARVLSRFTRQQLKPFLSVGKRQDLLTLADILATGRSRRSSTAPTPSTKQPTPSATSGPATPEGRSSSPSDDLTDENDPTRAYARPDLPPLRRTDRSSRKKNR